MPYQVKLEKFEGPLAMLLELIEKHKLSINDVSLAEVTDQYIEHLKKIEGFPFEEVSAFVAIASTLLLIKSASLIPTLQLSEEETGDIKDLEHRLRFYNCIRNFALDLNKHFGKNIMFSREAFVGFSFEFLEPKGITTEKLHGALKKIVAELPKTEILPEVLVKKTISLEKRIEEIISRIQQQMEISFSDSFRLGAKEKVEIIVSFLAILELIKRGFILVEQNQIFDNIKIRRQH